MNTSNSADSLRDRQMANASSLRINTQSAIQARPVNPTSGNSGTRYSADMDMQALLSAYDSLRPKPLATLTPTEARMQPSLADAAIALLEQQGRETWPLALVPGITTFDDFISGPDGMLGVRIYMPDGVGPFPVVVYFHGGGWVLGSNDQYDSSARGIAKHANAVVVSVNYRLAPEAAFPAQHQDALATYQWACNNATCINGDAKRIALAGECAGGTLALDTAIAARQRGLFSPLHVLAIYPIAQTSGMLTPSHLDCEHAKPLNRATLNWFAAQAFTTENSAVDLVAHERMTDLVDGDLDLLPPVTLISARIDPLRSDSDMLAAALTRARTEVQHATYDGVTHDFFGMAAVLSKAKQAQAFAGRRLKHSLCSR
jgi:acetyl esterase